MREVIDETSGDRFVYREDDHEAELVYRTEHGRIVLLHTLVPRELGGRGIAGQLVQAAVDRARGSGETIAPWCPYTRKWLRDHADAVADVTIDWTEAPARY